MAATLDTLMSQLPDGFSSIMKQSQEAARPEYEKGLQAEREYAKTKGELGVQKAELESRAARGAAGAQAAVYKKYEKELMAPPPTIQYNPDTVQGMQSLMVLLPIAGAMMGGGGQLSGIGALKAMSGVLEGHQQGNQDRIALETKNFEQQMQNWKLHMEQVKGAFERALQLAKINASAAQSGLKIELAKLDAKLLAADVERNGVTAPAQRNIAMIDKITNQIEQAQLKLISDKSENYLVNGKNMFLTDQQAKQYSASGAEVIKTGTKGAGGYQSVLLSGRAENIREAFAQVAKDMQNISKFPPEQSVLGTFAGMTGQSGKTLASSLSNTFARTITSTDSRMLQQLISGLEANMAMALGGGYASSAAAGRIEMYKQQIPQAGDDGYAVANFLARIRQEMNVLADNFASKPGVTPAMNEKVQEYNNLINQSIPFTVDDVMSSYFSGGEAPTTEFPYKTQEDVAAAFKSGKISEQDARKILKDKFGIE